MNKKIELINTLRDNSRIRISKISRKIREPVTTLYFTLKKLEESVIKRHVSIVNFEEHGFTRIFFVLPEEPKSAILKLQQHECVNNMMRTQKGFLIDAVFKDNRTFSGFKKTMENKRIKFSVHPMVETMKFEEMKI